MARPVSAPPAGRMINSATAAALAAQRGTPINMNSLLVATRRGNIQGAVKVKGRWKFPYLGIRGLAHRPRRARRLRP